MDDVWLMLGARRQSLQRAVIRPPRPVQQVNPQAPALPVQHDAVTNNCARQKVGSNIFLFNSMMRCIC